MKILLIRTTNGVSGTETHSILLFNALKKHKNISIHVLTNYKPFLHRLKQEHIPSSLIYHPIPEAGTKREFLLAVLWLYPMVFLYLCKIKQIEGKKRFDTIVLESMTEKLFLSPFLKLLGYRVIWIEQGSLFNTTRSAIVKWFYTYKSTRPDVILAVSENTKRDLVRGGVKASKIKVVHIGIDHISKLSERSIHKNRNITIGFLGGITKEKGIKEFLEAANKLVLKYPLLKFLIIGGGPLLEWSKKEVRRLGIQKNIEFTGYIGDVRQKLSSIDILYFPTHHREGLSLAILEAMAMGKIIVARDIGGNRELVIDKKTGFLFYTDREGEQILESIISGKKTTEAIKKSAIKYIQENFLMKNQIIKFISVFHG